MKWLVDLLAGFGIPETLSLAVIFALLVLGLLAFVPELLIMVLSGAVALAPLWLPILLAVTFWHMWMHYVRARHLAKRDLAVIEVKVPREIEKSPRAMELIFAGIHNVSSGEATFINRWIEGKTRPWWSFEIVSEGGRIHFYIWLEKRLREYTEAQIYAQYPGVEIYPVEDYATKLDFDPNRYNIWGCNFILNPSKSDAYPIKTYIDYELDKDPKEEYKIDPLAHLFEFMSTLKSGEHAWVQIMIRSNKDKRHKEGTWFGKEDRWKAEAKEELKSIKEAATPKIESPDGSVRSGFMQLSPSDEQKIKAIERSLEKSAFDTGIRGIYFAQKDAFKGTRIAGLVGVFKQFSSAHLNGIIPDYWHAKFDYPWQEWFGAYDRTSYKLVKAYKSRGWFHPPFKTDHFVMTTEELATIFHFPSRTIQAPGLDRIPARKAEPPPNLPI